MRLLIDIVNRTRTPVPTAWLVRPARVAGRVLARRLGIRRIGISLVGTARMRALNRRWRGMDRPTDVLSFCGSRRFVWPQATGAEAELVLALPVARTQARLRRVTLREELARLVIHGVAHLAGFDHERSEREARRMMVIETRIFHTVNPVRAKKKGILRQTGKHQKHGQRVF